MVRLQSRCAASIQAHLWRKFSNLSAEKEPAADQVKKLTKVAIIGAPNAGKSTLLNRLVGSEISCVSNKVHTTRKNELGIYTQDDTQIVIYDSPGVVTRDHLMRHRLEDSLHDGPKEAGHICDIIAVVVDASNIREQKRINKGVLELLESHKDNKKSVLLLNKVDLMKDKRKLIDIGIRLTQGCIDGKLSVSSNQLSRMSREELFQLNLMSHMKHSDAWASKGGGGGGSDLAPVHDRKVTEINPASKQSKNYIIDLDPRSVHHETGRLEEIAPDLIGYKHFSDVFSISALNDDGVDRFRNYLLSLGQPVELWPHGPDTLSSQSTKQVVHAIIRGQVMDHTDQQVPYLVKYIYQRVEFDKLGSLHVYITLRCPENYMVSRLLGSKGTNLHKIIEKSREAISRTLGCESNLIIQVDSDKNKLHGQI